MAKCVVLVVLLVRVVVAAERPLFIAFGDYGEDRPEFRQLVSELNKQREKVEFVALLGDLFYPKGVKSVEDVQFTLFEKFQFLSDSFHPVLGNHDYGYRESVSSLIAYSDLNPKWKMPARYYMRRIWMQKLKAEVCLFFIDTHVFESDQADWLRTHLASCQGSDKYRILFGHYPIFSVGVYEKSHSTRKNQINLLPIIEKFCVDAYISGHEHQLQAFERSGTHFLISGASSQLNRNKGRRDKESLWKKELKFVNDSNVGFLVFYEDQVSSRLTYSFIQAGQGGGKVLYSSPLRQIEGLKYDLPFTEIQAPTAKNDESRAVNQEDTVEGIDLVVATSLCRTPSLLPLPVISLFVHTIYR